MTDLPRRTRGRTGFDVTTLGFGAMELRGAPRGPELSDRDAERGRVYVAGAIEDASFPDEQKEKLTRALENAGVQHRVETYEGAKHGWVPSDSAVHNPAAAERHWQTLIDLFDTTLKPARAAE